MTTDPARLLERSRAIAVVGCSATPGKDAHEVPRFLIENGYEMYPVNPSAREILGRRTYSSLAEAPSPIDIVNVFRPADEAPLVARQAVALGARAVWLQTGIRSDEARRIAEAGGLAFVEDTCIRNVARELLDR